MGHLHYRMLPLLIAATFVSGWVAPGNSAYGEDATTPGPVFVASDTVNVQALRQRADAGNPSAQYRLAILLIRGESVVQDAAEAAQWFRRAAERGHAEAQFTLGLAYDNDRPAVAAQWYRRAAEQGHARAQYNLGISYIKGEGVPQDDSEARRWFRRAAEQGYTDAQYNLGIWYYTGEGVPQDAAEAAQWFRRAAEQGHGGAV